jgi:hypothetical protein
VNPLKIKIPVKYLGRYRCVEELNSGVKDVTACTLFRELLAHLQEAMHKQLVHCVRVIFVGCCQGWSGASSTSNLAAANRHNMQAIYQSLFV